ncbi:MAG: dihydropteroate synthase [Nitrospirota bacterium]
MKVKWKNFCLDFSQRTHIMGVLNVTPDSFSDGGRYFDESSATAHALRMAREGADVLDIGGESSRPGAEPLPLEEELKRTIPVIARIVKEISIPISIDTYKAEVAQKALDAGASIVNDISGLRFDPEMARIVARYEVPVVIMHMKGTPRDMQKNPVYDDLIQEILDYLRKGIRTAEESGIAEDRIIIDPGIGFGKTFAHNLQIIHKLHEFTLLGKPVLIGPSKKAFIGKVLGDVPPDERLEGTAAAVAISVMNGASLVRVHEVREMARVVKVADAIRRMKIHDA